jgi:hypothetical protein
MASPTEDLSNAPDEVGVFMHRRAFLVVAAAAAAWGVAGCAHEKKEKKEKPADSPTEGMHKAFAKIKKRIRKHVVDKSKHEPLVALVDAAERDLASVNRVVGDWRYTMARLTPEERQARAKLVEITTSYNRTVQNLCLDACKRAVEARNLMTEAEWPLVFPRPKGA